MEEGEAVFIVTKKYQGCIICAYKKGLCQGRNSRNKVFKN
jgi:hypothetical protein